MNRCNYCSVNLDLNLTKCPLCLRPIKGESSDEPLYPKYIVATQPQHKNFIFKLCLFLSIVIVSICLVTNALTWDSSLWSLYVVFPLLYLWLLIRNTIMSKTHIGLKILLQVIGASTLLYIIDMTANGHGWSVNMVIPFMIITTTVFITIFIYSKPIRWNEYIVYLTVMIFFGFIPIIFFLIGLVDILWPSVVSALNSLLTLVCIFIFSNKNFKGELKRRFHF